MDRLLLRVSVEHGDWIEFEDAIFAQDKEFIRRLKEEILGMNMIPYNSRVASLNKIDKLAGDKLK